MSKKSKSPETALANIDDYKPTLELTEEKLPDIKNWQVDSEHTLEVKVKVISLNRSQYSEDKKLRVSATIENVSADHDEDDPLRKGMDSVPVKNVRK